MVDELRSVAADTAVNRPVSVNAADANPAFAAQPFGGFDPGNPFADEFGDLAPFFEMGGGKGSLAVNVRGFHFNSGSRTGNVPGLSFQA